MGNSKWKFIREWVATSVILGMLVVSLTFTYRFGVESNNAQTNFNREKITLVQSEQRAAVQHTQDLALITHGLCEDNQKWWGAFQRVIASATNPPALAGKRLTAEQLAALSAYRTGLIQSVGPQPPAC